MKMRFKRKTAVECTSEIALSECLTETLFALEGLSGVLLLLKKF